MIGFYILNSDGDPVPCQDLDIVDAFLKDRTARTVQRDYFGDVEVSTVFLCLDHNYGYSQWPVLWETMIFGGEHDGWTQRYTSRADALKGHQEAVELVNPQVRKFKFEKES